MAFSPQSRTDGRRWRFTLHEACLDSERFGVVRDFGRVLRTAQSGADGGCVCQVFVTVTTFTLAFVKENKLYKSLNGKEIRNGYEFSARCGVCWPKRFGPEALNTANSSQFHGAWEESFSAGGRFEVCCLEESMPYTETIPPRRKNGSASAELRVVTAGTVPPLTGDRVME